LDEAEAAHQYALKLLLNRPRAVLELTDRLQRKGFSPDAIDDTIRYFAARGLLDDRAFAAWWVEQRQLFRPMGRRRLMRELELHGVSREVCEEVLADLDEEAEFQQALSVAAKRLGRVPVRCDARAAARRRLAGFLERRGFSPAVVRRATEKLLPANPDCE